MSTCSSKDCSSFASFHFILISFNTSQFEDSSTFVVFPTRDFVLLAIISAVFGVFCKCYFRYIA